MSAVRQNLFEPKPGLMPEFGRGRDARVPQAVTPDVEADALTELAHDSKHRSGLQTPVPGELLNS